VTTPTLIDAMGKKLPPLVIAVGRGAAVIPGARWIGGQAFPSDTGNADLERSAREGSGGTVENPVVVMGVGPYDWHAYNAALILVELGYHDVRWFRGGEESWAKAGVKADDLRTP
jgi:3-mercaptopyruvate sulfurtransferase SseA